MNDTIPSVLPSGQTLPSGDSDKKRSAVMHRTYDVKTVCFQTGGRPEKQIPSEFHISGEVTYSVSAVLLAAGGVLAAVGLFSAAARINRAAKYRRRYQRRYARKLQKEKERLHLRYEKDAKALHAEKVCK